MESFKKFHNELLHEAYNIIPRNENDIKTLLVNNSIDTKEVILFIHKNFKKLYGEKWEDSLPLTVDNKKIGQFKFRRGYDLKKMSKLLKTKFTSYNIKSRKSSFSVMRGKELICTISEGEGSRNKKAGGGAKGLQFERELAIDLETYSSDPLLVKYKDICDSIYDILKKEYKIDLTKDKYEVLIDGGKNVKRKPSWSPSTGLIFNPSGNIGHIVTDLTVISNKKKAFLSLKFSNQFYMVNATIRPYLHEKNPYEDIKERNELARYFGFNPKLFYNAYGITSDDDYTPSESQVKKAWAKILKEVIGYGYIYVVGGGKHDIVINSVDEPKINVKSITNVLYALKGKRKYSKISLIVDIEGRGYSLDCQFRGTEASHILPYYLRVLVT